MAEPLPTRDWLAEHASAEAPAHQGWEQLWRDAGVVAAWQRADPGVEALAETVLEAGGRRALDLGCGVGRHTLAMAARSLTTVATDISPTALASVAAAARRAGLRIALARAGMAALPMADACVDLVVAYHVLYHGLADDIARALGEIRRVLRPSGRAYFTLISANDGKRLRLADQAARGAAVALEPFTFCCPDQRDSDDFLPHHFTSEDELRGRFMRGFRPLQIEERRSEGSDRDQGWRLRAHWHVIAAPAV